MRYFNFGFSNRYSLLRSLHPAASFNATRSLSCINSYQPVVLSPMPVFLISLTCRPAKKRAYLAYSQIGLILAIRKALPSAKAGFGRVISTEFRFSGVFLLPRYIRDRNHVLQNALKWLQNRVFFLLAWLFGKLF